MKIRMSLKENDRGFNVVEVSTSYSLGGMNYFTGKEERRGYYLHIQPMQVSNGCQTITAFSGAKWLLKETKRKSAKAEQEAERIAEQMKDNCIKMVLDKNGVDLA